MCGIQTTLSKAGWRYALFGLLALRARARALLRLSILLTEGVLPLGPAFQLSPFPQALPALDSNAMLASLCWLDQGEAGRAPPVVVACLVMEHMGHPLTALLGKSPKASIAKRRARKP